jgi:hypothetical protein
MKKQDGCLDCLASYYCPSTGMTAPTACPVGTVNAPGSTSCGTECDYENYYYSSGACRKRTVFCNYNLQYEKPVSNNRTAERTCINLKPCNTARMSAETAPVLDAL